MLQGESVIYRGEFFLAYVNVPEISPVEEPTRTTTEEGPLPWGSWKQIPPLQPLPDISIRHIYMWREELKYFNPFLA